ncbi:fasciclin domain-containing protein, partial [Streptomyces sp. NPDC101237]
MNTRIRRTAVVLAAAAVLPLALSACSDSSGDSAKSSTSDKASASDGSMSGGGATTADEPFGPACSGVP